MKKLYKLKESKRPVDLKRTSAKSEPYRDEIRQDYARLIHSPAFRRLQGKTQLYPGIESDFFRNRLTHSLEVSQISESICFKVNYEHSEFKKDEINPRICAIAGLAHDLGHPPFGHNGEKALDDCMKQFGGFEGNAQTLRIISTLEKKEQQSAEHSQWGIDEDGNDCRRGLNLTFRVIASILKYDNKIDISRKKDSKLQKGYYASDEALVRQVKNAVCGDENKKGFKTVECSIMDVADDIAYSTYDIEDAFKGGFLTPLDVLSPSQNLMGRVTERVSERLGKPTHQSEVVEALYELFYNAAIVFEDNIPAGGTREEIEKFAAATAVESFDISKLNASVGYYRTSITSHLIRRFIDGVKVEYDKHCPALSVVKLDDDTAFLVEVLKVFSFEWTILSSMLKVAENRGYELVRRIFDVLSEGEGYQLLPDDFKAIFTMVKNDEERQRTICDFIAGMTDNYAAEFHSRLGGEGYKTIFKPL